jgi:[glutamine synthetase] adenylyltransferase / [glutamine synthetase]-adenylyl-L-tyrosine phosphorylase
VVVIPVQPVRRSSLADERYPLAKPAPKTSATTADALRQRVIAAPQPSSAAEAARKVDDWLGEIGRSGPGKSIKQLVAKVGAVRRLLEGIADGSPFLWQLVTEDPARLLRILDSEPEAHFSALLAEAAAAVPAAKAEAQAMQQLRRLKAEAALLIALADIGGVWPVQRVTRALTDLADAAIGAAVRFLLGRAAAEGRLRPADPDHPDRGSGYFVLAMGKMGAFELNYSSDVDLIVLFDPAAPALDPALEPAPFHVRLTRGLVKLLQERTPDGYVFRVDLRLRPDPASTQIAVSTPAALGYYESTGQNWERAALIKARPCAGDLAAGEAFLADLTPFVWRKYLDYVAIADVHAMKRQIHAYRGHDDIAVEGHNLKLGRGGIREIEFFVQTQQLIAGGRHPELRGRGTLEMLKRLAEGGWIDAAAAQDLHAAYCFLRTVEHRLQMVADEQTQTLPSDPEALARFARFLGFADREHFAETLLGHLRAVQRHYARLFEAMPGPTPARALEFPEDADDSATLARLTEMGFRQPLAASATVRQWFSGGYPSLKGEFARSRLSELMPALLQQLSRTDDPDRTLVSFDRFLAGLQGGARLISLLGRNPDLLALLALTLGTAPRLADLVSQNPQAMDGLIDPAFFGALPDAQKLGTQLDRMLAQAASYEDLLDRARLFGQEQMVLIGARILSGTVSAEQAGETFARLADVLIAALHRAVEESFAAAHGRLPGQHTAVLALGKLGGGEMTAASDLDLILVYDFEEAASQSDGRRSLSGMKYFARLTQRLISALTAQTNYGALYRVDMRLRPTGRSGPVATSIARFRDYQEREAWTWEHMALTRARVVSAAPEFCARIEAVIAEVLGRPRDRAAVAADILEMRAAIAAEKGEGERWDLRYAGGGLVDVEFIAQYLELVHAAEHREILDVSTARALEKAARLGVLAPEDADILRPAARLYQNLTHFLRLCLTAKFDPENAGPGLLGLLARAADLPDFTTLDAHLIETQKQVRACFLRILEARR